MKKLKMFGWMSAFCLIAAPMTVHGEVTMEELKQQLQQAQEAFRKAQELHQQQMQELTRRLDAMQKKQDAAAQEQKELKERMETPIMESVRAEAAPLESRAWRPTDPIRIRSGSAFLDIGLVGTFAAGGSTASDIEGGTQLGGHDPNQRGFTVQGVEATFSGAIDPYFRGLSTVVFQIDSEGESFLEVEEAYLETLSLPANLQVRGGQFFTEFGRHNTLHTHSWSFVDQPLVVGRLLGPDGLRGPGGRVAWLMPTPFYSELFLAVQNSQGETAHSFRNEHEDEAFLGRLHGDPGVRSLDDMLFAPRYAVSFDVTDTQTLLLGASAAFGPNASSADTDTEIYGVDLYWKWRPVDHSGGFPFVSWQTEAMLRRFKAGFFTEDLDGSGVIEPGEPDLNGDGLVDSVPRETLRDWGAYSQVLWGFRRGWVAGLRGEYVARDNMGAYETVYGNDPERAARWRISPNLTWYPSEFSKIRLQYNYDDRRYAGVDHSVWLQFEFILGAHAAHKF